MYRFCALVLVLHLANSEDVPLQSASLTLDPQTKASEKRMSETLLQILEHYKQPDPVGLPGAPIPDPMDIPKLKHRFSIGTMEMFNSKMYGLSKFRMKHIFVDINAMKVEAALNIDILNVKGNYTLSTWLSKAKGPYSVNLTNVNVIAKASLEVERNGQLEAQDIDMDIAFKDIAMDFQGLGFFAGMFQGVMNSVGTFVFDSIKPFVLSESNKNIRSDVNKEVKKFPMKFPNSISPLDGVICELRKKIRSLGYDPYKVPDYNNTVGVVDVFLTNTWLYGISSFHRTREISIDIKNRSVSFLIEVGTGRLEGTSNWEMSFLAGIMSKFGNVDFTVEHIKVGINISQSMDTTQAPVLDDLQLELGNIQIRFNGLGTVDYAIELGINVLPNLLRYQIMDALEKPIKLKIQEALDHVNVEQLIRENADKLDNMNDIDEMKFL